MGRSRSFGLCCAWLTSSSHRKIRRFPIMCRTVTALTYLRVTGAMSSSSCPAFSLRFVLPNHPLFDFATLITRAIPYKAFVHTHLYPDLARITNIREPWYRNAHPTFSHCQYDDPTTTNQTHLQRSMRPLRKEMRSNEKHRNVKNTRSSTDIRCETHTECRDSGS